MPFELIPSGTNIDFIGKRFLCFGISISLLLAGLIAIPVRGIRLGIDFAGGHGDADSLRRGTGGR